MNILIVFVAGISAGWVAEKLYHSFVAKNKPEKATATVTATAAERDRDDTQDKHVKEKEPLPLVEEKHDDLSQLKGVGPKLAEALDGIGIYTYKELSASSVDRLFEQLRETGGRFSEPVISLIVERAKLAAEER